MTRGATTVLLPMRFRLGLSREDAAEYLGMKGEAFDRYVANGRLPACINIDGTKVWDRESLDHAARDGFGFIYFIRCAEFLKIGYSTDVPKRVSSLQSASPLELELVCTTPGRMEDEADLHRRFADLRHIREWFRYEGALKEYVEGLQNG